MKILMTGGTGFIGSHLMSYLEQRGHEVILLSQHAERSNILKWNLGESQLDSRLEGIEVVINLAGENIFCRWNERKKEQIHTSRIQATQDLVRILLMLKIPPKLYIGASAMGYYGDRKNEILTENDSAGNDFLSAVCTAWENAARPLHDKNIRVVYARFGVVLAKDGGALKFMEKGFRMGMGGYLGSGKQILSWIAIEDLCSAIQHTIDHAELVGPVNFASPQAISNQEFSQILGKLLNRPALLPVPKFALSMIFGDGAEMLLSSIHMSPKRLLETGYHFRYPELEPTLKNYMSDHKIS